MTILNRSTLARLPLTASLAVAIVLGLGLASGHSQAAEGKLRIATEGAYPPFNEKTADGKLIGFDVDIAKALCMEMKRECEIVAQDWDGIIPGLVNNKYDAIAASMSITEERQQTIDFSAPYYTNYIAVVARADARLSMDDLKSRPLGAQRATVASQWAEDTFGRRADLKLYDTQTAAYADLEAGRIEALVSDWLPVAAWLEGQPSFAPVGEPIDINDKIGIGIRKGDTELKTALDEALATIRANGIYKAINDKYFKVDIY